MFFDPNLTIVLRDVLPWASPFFQIITELGSEIFYVALILVGYWAYNKREAILTTLVLLFSVLTNYWLKLAIANPRPDQSYWYPGQEATNYSTPSGHAQNSTMLFGWFALRAKKQGVIFLSTILIFLIGISRVYLGVHYLGDVLLGWTIGLIFVVAIYLAEPSVSKVLSNIPKDYTYLCLFLFGFGATVVSTYLLPQPPDDNFGALGGLTMGIAIAFLLEDKFVRFETKTSEKPMWKIVLRVVIGLVLVLALMVGLKDILPSTDVWLRALRYLIVAIVGVFVWPFAFKKANM